MPFRGKYVEVNNPMNWIVPWSSTERYLDVTDFEGEIWKPFTELKGKGKILQPWYYLSNLGRLKSVYTSDRPKILPGTFDATTGGYVGTMVRTVDKKQYGMSYHIQVGYYFLGDPPKNILDPTIDHINCNKLDNRASNLQWLSRSDNSKKAIKDGLCEAFMTNGGWNRRGCYIVEYPNIHFNSLSEAAHFMGRNDDYIAECIRSNRTIKHSQGYTLHVMIDN